MIAHLFAPSAVHPVVPAATRRDARCATAPTGSSDAIRRAAASLAVFLGVGLSCGSAVQAGEVQRGVVSFSASATQEFDHDLMTVTLQVVREAAQAAEAQAALRLALDASLAEARKVTLPGALDVRTGTFAVFPRYGANGKVQGWQGSAQLVVEGTDLPRIAQLVTRLSPFSVSDVRYSLSRELRQRQQSAVAAEAIAAWRRKAQELALAFGHRSWSLGEVSVQGEDGASPVLRPALMARAAMADAPGAAPSLPVEPGRGQVTVVVSGNVLLQP